MADLEVFFLHPTTQERRSARVDDVMTASEAISDLVEARFLEASESGYHLAIKGGAEIPDTTSLRVAGVQAGNTLRVIPISESAGQNRVGRD